MERLCSIYGLSSSKDGVVRYIGQTAQSLERRLIQHFAEAKRSDTRLHRWIRATLRAGYSVDVSLLEAGCPWDAAERRWIASYRRENPGMLTNTSNGGCGYSGKRSEEIKAKMRGPKSEAHRAAMCKPKSEKARAAMSASLVGNSRSRGEANRTAILTETAVAAIKLRLSLGESGSEIAREFGVQKAAISKIKRGRNWSHVAPLSGPS